jgi:hypothetical protein
MSGSPPVSESFAVVRGIITDAITYWETRRIVYNLLLTAVVIAWLVFTWPHFREDMTLHSLVLMLVLAVMANVCYCAAYLADIPMQCSSFRTGWLRWRWGLWLAGTLFAILVANYWIVDEIYPYAGQ